MKLRFHKIHLSRRECYKRVLGSYLFGPCDCGTCNNPNGYGIGFQFIWFGVCLMFNGSVAE